MLTFKNLQDYVLRLQDQTGETGHGLSLVKDALQTVHDRRLTEERWTFMLWPFPITLQFKTDKRQYQLHEQVLMLSEFKNITADELMVETPSRARYKIGVQGDRYHFEFVQTSPVKLQPVLGALTVTGSAKIKFLNNLDEVVEETVTDATTTGSAKEVIKVTKLNANPLTIVDIDANTILSLTAAEFGKQYPQIRLMDDGVGTEKAEYRFYRKPTVLVDDNDIPDIPYPYSRVMIFDALLEMATYDDAAPPAYWLAQQELWDRQLRQNYQEGETEGSESRQVIDSDVFSG